MRLIAVLLIALFVFGTIAAYERFVASLPRFESTEHELAKAEGKFSVELTLSFNAEVDAFAAGDEAAVLVRMAGDDLIRHTEPLTAGETLRASDVQQVVAGRNAFFVRALPAESEREHPCVARVKILRDGEVVAENSIWSAPGEVLAGELLVEVE